MSCLCCFKSRSKDHNFLHWPNFTFSHSQPSLNKQRRHSTFSLQERQKSKRTLKRKSTVQSEPTFSTFWKPRKSRPSPRSTESEAHVRESNDLSDQQSNLPPSPSPTIENVAMAGSGQRHVRWAGLGSMHSTRTITSSPRMI